MKMKICIKLLTFFVILISGLSHASAQSTESVAPVKNQVGVVDSIVANYVDWQTVELNGKLRMDKLPLSPSVRIFMSRDEEISISVRASFLGEVGRIRIWGDSILAINKMKRVYSLESLDRIKSFYPNIVSELQSLLLGRVVVFGSGELSQANQHQLDIYDVIPGSVEEITPEEAMWSIENSIEVGSIGDIDYRYDLFKDGRINEFLVGLYDHDIFLGMKFLYPGNKTALEVMLKDGEKVKFDVTMEFDKPNWGASPMSPLKLNSKFTRLPISQFIKSFKF